MTNSPVSPRASLIARSRKHFAAMAATGLVLAGGVTAWEATTSTPAQATSSTGTVTDSSSSGSTSSPTPSSGSGLVAPSVDTPSDGASNAS